MRGKKARQLRKNVYGDMHHKTDYTGKIVPATIRVGRAVDEQGKRVIDSKKRKLSLMQRVMRIVPKLGDSCIKVGKLRQEYKETKKSCRKGISIKYKYCNKPITLENLNCSN